MIIMGCVDIKTNKQTNKSGNWFLFLAVIQLLPSQIQIKYGYCVVRISPFPPHSRFEFFLRPADNYLTCLLWVDFRVRNLVYRYPIYSTGPLSGEGWSHPIVYYSEYDLSLYDKGMVFSPSFPKCWVIYLIQN